MSLSEDTPSHDEGYCPTCERSYPASVAICEADGSRLVPLNTRDPLLGTALDGRFEIVERLGSGGMGAVYTGRQTSVDRPVAIKVMQSRFGNDADITRRFIREAKLASKLNHPNSVAVIDFGQTTDGLLYLVMELVNGRTLADLVRDEGPQAVPRVVDIGVQAASALAAAHDCGIVHRDLKPTNIMIEERQDGDLVKVLDFGVAKNLNNEGTQLTHTDAVVGTPTYMSPEAVRGLATDGRSDLYALGLILYELLNGLPPFVEQLAENQGVATVDGGGGGASQPLLLLRDMALKLAYCHAEVEPAPLGDPIPGPLAAIVMRLLHKSPADRYQNAAQLKEALAAFATSMRAEGGFPRARTMPPVRVASESGLAADARRAGTAPTALAVPVHTDRLPSRGAVAAGEGEILEQPTFRAKNVWVLRGIAIVGAIALGIGMVALTRGGGDPSPKSAAKPTGPTALLPSRATPKAADPDHRASKPGPALKKEGAPDSKRTGGEIRLMERPEPAGLPRLVMWRLASTPQAEVWVEGEMIGRTPLLYEVEIGDEPIDVEFRKDGYASSMESLVPTPESRGVSVELEKQSAPPKRSSTTRRKPGKPGRTGSTPKKRAGDSVVDPFAN